MRRIFTVFMAICTVTVALFPFILVLGQILYWRLPLEENHMRWGRDTEESWQDGRYQILRGTTGFDKNRDSQYPYEYALMSGNPEEGTLMQYVYGYFLSGDKAYLVSEDGGYAILHFPSETYTPIEHLEELSAEEQDIFTNMQNFTILHELD